jgi:hypothetical protein
MIGAFVLVLLSFCNLRSLRTFLSLNYLELDFVTLCERLETGAGDCAEVDEDVWTAFAGDEPEPLSVVEPLHSARNA